jgi:hypothetical protein
MAFGWLIRKLASKVAAAARARPIISADDRRTGAMTVTPM